jgi:hypothetical protein
MSTNTRRAPTSWQNVLRLARKHLQLYWGRYKLSRQGLPGYRADELKHYIRLWQEVVDNDGVLGYCSQSAQNEVMAAINDEANQDRESELEY